MMSVGTYLGGGQPQPRQPRVKIADTPGFPMGGSRSGGGSQRATACFGSCATVADRLANPARYCPGRLLNSSAFRELHVSISADNYPLRACARPVGFCRAVSA